MAISKGPEWPSGRRCNYQGAYVWRGCPFLPGPWCQCHASDPWSCLAGILAEWFPSISEELRYREPSNNSGWSGRTNRCDDLRTMNIPTMDVISTTKHRADRWWSTEWAQTSHEFALDRCVWSIPTSYKLTQMVWLFSEASWINRVVYSGGILAIELICPTSLERSARLAVPGASVKARCPGHCWNQPWSNSSSSQSPS